ncbi:MAG TPA: NUDIX domain-containing protein, partial [Terriglobales bacterium]|nr:NUDIX domain-containing protein [Terriglobales bacterium]
MSGERYRTLSAVFPVLLREEGGKTEVLLARRQNTGYMDGLWDLAGSGHVDEGETALAAVRRECGEELGIKVDPDGVVFAHLCHRLGLHGARTYYDLYFFVKLYTGPPRIAEPDKCSDLRWFDADNLPEDTIVLRRQALSHIF